MSTEMERERESECNSGSRKFGWLINHFTGVKLCDCKFFPESVIRKDSLYSKENVQLMNTSAHLIIVDNESSNEHILFYASFLFSRECSGQH